MAFRKIKRENGVLKGLDFQMATTKGKTKSRTSRAPSKAQLQKQRKKQFYAIILFAIGLFLAAVSLIDGPAVWGFLHDCLRGIFGPVCYAVGPLTVVMAVIITVDKEHVEVHHKVWQTVVLVILLCGFSQIFYGLPEGEGFWGQFSSLYLDGVLLKSGGVLAAILGWPLLRYCGTAGAAIILLLAAFVFLMLITGSTLMGFFKTCAKPVKHMEESYVQFKEQREEKRKSRFNIDIPLDEDPPMPEHPVSSPNAVFEDEAPIPDKVVVDTRTGEVIDEILKNGPQDNTPDIDPDIFKVDAVPVGETVKDDAPLDALINKAIDDFKTPPEKVERNSVAEQTTSEGEAAAPAQPDPKKQAPIPMDITVEAPVENVYHFPPISLLKQPKSGGNLDVSEELKANAAKLVDTLKSFGVQTRIIDICRGPTVTRYELQPSAGVKISKITGLADDIALNLATAGVRIEAPIPNKPAVGIEVPNRKTDIVSIREIVDSEEFRNAKSKLTMALGRDIAGNITVGDIGSMPHLLIAGATGSGKSVCVNSIIISLLYKSSPEEVRFLMIDPKVVELGIYNGIPHLLVPVVTDPRKAAGALGWAVTEMLNRYKAFADNNVRDLKGYNRLASKTEGMDPMPQIVVIIDELADLMMAAPNEVEDSICRLAQMARAAGMHLIIATQRPSVDVITGVIKANIPSRIAFSVSSQVDSRTILDGGGAEKLLGRGDMLFYPVGYPKPVRVQGCFVSDTEVEQVVDFIKNKQQPAEYDDKIMEEIERQAVIEKKKGDKGGSEETGDTDPLFNDAVDCVLDAGQASTSYLQRRLKVGYARAARLVDELEDRGIVGPLEGSKPREVLITRQQWVEISARNAGDI